MLRCSEPGCKAHVMHDDSTPLNSHLCCPHHCTCYDKYTHSHQYVGDDDISCNTPHSHEVYLSESKLRLYWDRTHNLPDKAKSGIESIRFGKDVPKDVRDWVMKNLVRLRRVFESNTNGIPLLVKGDPVRINLKADAKPRRCPMPKWGYGAKRSVLTKHFQKQLDCGMMERAGACEWASRPHIALKPFRGTSRDSDVFDIRVVGDYVQVNSQIQRLQPNGPDSASQIKHASGHHAYWYTDGDQQYQN